MRVFEPLWYMHVDGLSPRIVMYTVHLRRGGMATFFIAINQCVYDKTFIVVADKLGFIL